jgi:hypothetical protein
MKSLETSVRIINKTVKNLADKEAQYKDLNSKHLKLTDSADKLKHEHEMLWGSQKGLELKFNREKTFRNEIKGKLSRADEDCKLQLEANKELNKKN